MPWSWGRRPATAPAPTTPATPDASPPVDLDSFRAIADLAQKEYVNENDRTKTLDGKAGPLIGATGAATVFLIGTLIKPPDVIASHGGVWIVVYFSEVVLALLFLFLAQVGFLQSVAIRATFRRVRLNDWIDYAVMRQPGARTYAELAATYAEAVEVNTALNNAKAALQTKGLRCLLAGTIGLALIPATIVVAINL